MELFKKILRITFWVLLVAGLGTIFAFVQKQENEQLCSTVNISILKDTAQDNFFVEEGQIRDLIAHRFGQVENTPMKNIDVNYLERLMYSNPWVAKADVYLTINGVVNIEIEQRHPFLRIINEKQESFYMDSRGSLMLWSPDFIPRSLIASGNISESYEQWKGISIREIINNDTLKTRTVLDDLYAMARFILADEFWSAHIEQVYVNTNKEIELVPKVGDHKIIFGGSDDMAEKFWKLKTFYKEGLNYTGWNSYDTLNLKFKNQVVCSKTNLKPAVKSNKNSTSTH